MAKAVSDVNGERQGGFAMDNSQITGFSHMHDSGTGGVSFSDVVLRIHWLTDMIGSFLWKLSSIPTVGLPWRRP
jgi:hypothetical protein